MAWIFSTTTKNARAAAITSQIGVGGRLIIYTTAYATVLATYTWSGNMFGAPVNGVITSIDPIVNPILPIAAGVAAIARIAKADGTTFIVSGLSVGMSGADIIVNNDTFVLTSGITLGSITITEG